MVRQLAVARREGDRGVDDRRAGGPRRLHERARVLQHPGLLHHLLDRAVQSAALRGEVVLVLDQDDGSVLGIDWHGSLLVGDDSLPTLTPGASHEMRRSGRWN